MRNTYESLVGEPLSVTVSMSQAQQNALKGAIGQEIATFNQVRKLKTGRDDLVRQAEESIWGIEEPEIAAARDLFSDTINAMESRTSHDGTILHIYEFGREFEADIQVSEDRIPVMKNVGSLAIAAIDTTSRRILAALKIYCPGRDPDMDNSDYELGFAIYPTQEKQEVPSRLVHSGSDSVVTGKLLDLLIKDQSRADEG